MNLEAGRVIQLRLDYQVGLVLENFAVFSIEVQFEVISQNHTITVNPETGENFDAVLSRIHTIVEGIDVGVDGSATINFADGVRWVVNPDGRYETWQYNEPTGDVRVVSGSDGTLSVWGLEETR